MESDWTAQYKYYGMLDTSIRHWFQTLLSNTLTVPQISLPEMVIFYIIIFYMKINHFYMHIICMHIDETVSNMW